MPPFKVPPKLSNDTNVLKEALTRADELHAALLEVAATMPGFIANRPEVVDLVARNEKLGAALHKAKTTP